MKQLLVIVLLCVIFAAVFAEEVTTQAAPVQSASLTEDEEEVLFEDVLDEEGAAAVESCTKVLSAGTFSHADTLFTLPIHGRYCGPGFCGGRTGDYTKNACNFGIQPADDFDSCCKIHDSCCINNRKSCLPCESAILACWDRVINRINCRWFDFACKARKTKFQGIRAIMAARPKNSCC